MEKLANHIALQSIAEGGMEKKALNLGQLAAVGALLTGVAPGVIAATKGSEDNKTLSGILGAGTGLVGGQLGGTLGALPGGIMGGLGITKVKNPKLQAALMALGMPLAAIGGIGGSLAGSAGAGYSTGKFVDWLADKIG